MKGAPFASSERWTATLAPHDLVTLASWRLLAANRSGSHSSTSVSQDRVSLVQASLVSSGEHCRCVEQPFGEVSASTGHLSEPTPQDCCFKSLGSFSQKARQIVNLSPICFFGAVMALFKLKARFVVRFVALLL